MASTEACPGSDPSGYKYEFKDKVNEDLLCQICKCVAREPNFTTCCGDLFCKECISLCHRNNQPCPICEETSFNIGLKKRDQKRILALKLYCPMKSRGCEWMGQLEQLDNHMNVQSGDCLYVDIECPSHCDQRVQKRNIQNHLSQECPLREYTCPHCNFKASYKIVSEDHLEVCSYLPVQCPNRCGVTCEREDLEDHMKMCNKKELECCFSHAGCQGKFLREDEERHMEENAKNHLSLMATATLKISMEMKRDKERNEEIAEEQEVEFQEKLQEQKVKFQEKLQEQEVEFQEQEVKFQEKLQEQEVKFQEKLQEQEVKFQENLQEQEVKFQENLQEQDVKFQGKLQEQEMKLQLDLQGKEEEIKKVREQLVEMEAKWKHLERALEEHDNEGAVKLKDVNDKVAELQYNTGYFWHFPVTFTMPFFKELKARNRMWCSPLMSTNVGRYGFRIVVCPNGHRSEGHNTHVSVLYKSEVGNYDAQLKLPVTITITLQLLNQHADKDHVTKTFNDTYETPCVSNKVVPFELKFVSLKELDFDKNKETQYLKNNSLHFKVVGVEAET